MRCALVLIAAGLAACGTGDTGAGGSVQFSASGEVLALEGYGFPPATADDVAFVDGWDVQFDKILVTIDRLRLSDNPDISAADQSQTGKVVAEVDGPWAIDLHQGGPLAGKGGTDEEAYPVATLDNQNENGRKSFDPTVRYAFSFDTVPATADATFLQMDANDTDYAEMIANGWTVLYIGTATFKGTTCTNSDAAFDFTQLPATVHFRLGFASPTSYLNCQNPDNDPAQALGQEEHERGIQVKENATIIAQVTIHTDHPFWESFVHDSPARFDALAASAKNVGGNFQVTLADTTGVDYHTFTFDGQSLPWRSCIAGETWPGLDPQMGFADLGHTVADFAAYLTYNQSTQGHLNSDGLCYVSRNY